MNIITILILTLLGVGLGLVKYTEQGRASVLFKRDRRGRFARNSYKWQFYPQIEKGRL